MKYIYTFIKYNWALGLKVYNIVFANDAVRPDFF